MLEMTNTKPIAPQNFSINTSSNWNFCNILWSAWHLSHRQRPIPKIAHSSLRLFKMNLMIC